MTRLFALTAAVAALTACYDFTGTREKLGFTTDATVGGIGSWSPEVALAEGARPALSVTEILATGQEPESPARFDASRNVSLSPDGRVVYVSGSGRGWIGAEADGWRDDFRLRWRPATDAALVDPLAVLTGDDEDLVSVLVLEDSRTVLGFALRDRRGAALGYVPAQVDIEAHGVSLEPSKEHWTLVSGKAGDASLTVSWPGGPAASPAIEVVPAEAIDTLTLRELHHEGECGVQARLWSDGHEVLGARDLTWSHDLSTGPIASCGESVTATWGDLSATL